MFSKQNFAGVNISSDQFHPAVILLIVVVINVANVEPI